MSKREEDFHRYQVTSWVGGRQRRLREAWAQNVQDED